MLKCLPEKVFGRFSLLSVFQKSKMKKLILASQSPRRKQLLSESGIEFLVRSVPTEEHFPSSLNPKKVPEFIAENKAKALWEKLSEVDKNKFVVLSADTIVVLGNHIFGKPKDEAEAISTLKALSGKQHSVITGVCILAENEMQQFSVQTKVYFRELSNQQITFYVKNYKPFDKAGAYAIQEWIGLIGIEKIEGDYYNVVGLPVGEVIKRLPTFFNNLTIL